MDMIFISLVVVKYLLNQEGFMVDGTTFFAISCLLLLGVLCFCEGWRRLILGGKNSSIVSSFPKHKLYGVEMNNLTKK